MRNRLAGETSPYLRQHADNPVDWYPWGEEALARAKRENKPILLSIGYSACHWCHVMAHESFEDAGVAALMNDLFINVKVDREERPDLDQIYQTAHAMLTRRGGGWPLTMFLTPQQEPFFGGTYFPKTSRYGLSGFVDMLPQLARAYREQGEAIAEQNERLKAALALTLPEASDDRRALPTAAPASAYASLAQSFDPVDGGFGQAPKFPHAAELDFCLRRYASTGDEHALRMVRVTLARMAEGGIHDQLAGGFSRYSVDAEWTIPHFEKMLYDNASLLGLYADAWRVTHDAAFEKTARGIVAWLESEMLAPGGGFYSSLDADSEHEEGKFYVWTPDQAKTVLDSGEYAVAARHWGLDRPPNFEHAAWHLRVTASLEQIARELSLPLPEVDARLESARAKLLAARTTRVRPGREDKLLCSWNALMIGALARASRVFDEHSWLDDAQRAADFIRREMWRDDRLLATYKDGRAHLNAYLDDYAFLLAALVELMQTAFRPEDLAWAIEIADALLARFEDPAGGGFLFTSDDHEKLLLRPKPGHDNATPSGNGIAAQSLLALGHWLSEQRYLDGAERAVRAFSGELSLRPSGFSSLLVALEACLEPPQQLLLRGDAATCLAWQRHVEGRYRPSLLTLALAQQSQLPAALAKPHDPGGGPVTAWLCQGAACLPPLHTLTALDAALAS